MKQFTECWPPPHRLRAARPEVHAQRAGPALGIRVRSPSPPVSVSLRNALYRKTARWITPAGRFVNPHGHKGFDVFRRPANGARHGTRSARKRRDRPFSSLSGPILSDSSGHTPGVARQTYILYVEYVTKLAPRDARWFRFGTPPWSQRVQKPTACPESRRARGMLSWLRPIRESP